MHLYKRSSKATDGTSQPQDKVQQLLNLHAKMFYKLGNKILLRPIGVPLKIKNYSKKRMFKAVSSFLYKTVWLLQKKHVFDQYYRDFTLERNESDVPVEENTLKINQYYFLTFPIPRMTRKDIKATE